MATARAGTETAAAIGALAEIGEPAIADLAIDTAPARNCRQHFGTERDALLREYEWNFATGWATPAAASQRSIGPLALRYLMPADCLTVRFVRDAEADQWAVEAANVTDESGAEIEAVVLVTNIEAPIVCYTQRVANVALWDPLFLKIFQLRLAIAVGPAIGRDTTTVEKKLVQAVDQLEKAKRADAREKAPKRVSTDTSWLAARRGVFRR